MKAFEHAPPRDPSQELADIAKFLRKGFKLEPELKAKWVTALRSGDYKQGTNYLLTYEVNPKGTYCCMGVLGCMQGIEAKWLTNRMHLSDIYGAPHVLPERMETFLASLNDGSKWTFAQIADWVEVNL